MTAFLLALSLLLNIVALLAIILLFLRQNKLMDTEKNQRKMLIEMEDVISSYLLQMKEENDEFINRVSQLDPKSQTPKKEEKQKNPSNFQGEMDRENLEFEADEKSTRIAKASVYQASRAYKANSKPAPKEMNEPPEFTPINETDTVMLRDDSQHNKDNAPLSLDNVVLSLEKQGMSVEEIAKKLGKGKTEIALILKFRHNQQ